MNPRRLAIEVFGYIIVAFVITLPIRWFIAVPFVVTGTSMSPTFEAGDYLIVDKLSYRSNNPQRGDIVVFRYPLDPSIYYIKRIVGLPTETVSIVNGVATLIESDGTKHALAGPKSTSVANANESLTTKLAADEYYVLGDNRDTSSDSRDWGPLQRKYIVGGALMRLLPLREIGLLPGASASTTVQ